MTVKWVHRGVFYSDFGRILFDKKWLLNILFNIFLKYDTCHVEFNINTKWSAALEVAVCGQLLTDEFLTSGRASLDSILPPWGHTTRLYGTNCWAVKEDAFNYLKHS